MDIAAVRADRVDGRSAASDVAALRPGTLREGAGEPLMLLHGITGSAGMWRRVMPLLAARYDVIAPTLLGHRGGPVAVVRPLRVAHLVDDLERWIDRLGFDSVHLAGNSLGGWVALELARRGRARSVCALSPAGAWSEERTGQSASKLRATAAKTRWFRPLLPALGYFPAVRHVALQENALHGERVTRRELIALADDLLGCRVLDELLDTPEQLAPLTASCPITIAWSRGDRVFPVDVNGAHARAVVPAARFMVLEDVGHVPMFDDSERVAQTILEAATPGHPAARSPEQSGIESIGDLDG